jgi:phosphomannomutase/phosphoglucomutase
MLSFPLLFSPKWCNGDLARLFGTDGVRGRVFTELSPMLALRLGMAIGTYYGEGSTILVGRDTRAGGDVLLRSVVAGLMAAGAKVKIAGVHGYAPTPAVQYAVKMLGYDAGVMVTASHNPPEYNGIKVISPLGVEIDADTERKIEEIYFSERFHMVSWNRAIHDAGVDDRVIDEYVRGVVEKVDKALIRQKGFRVLVDCANSVTSLTTPRILRELGVKVYSIGCEIDARPYREPEPSIESLREASTIVKALKLDLGVAHDGDGDRVTVIDDEGIVWLTDRTSALLTVYIAETKLTSAPRRVVTPVATSRAAVEYLEKHGIEIKWTPVGMKHVAYTLLREGGLVGFEENGFMYPPHLLARDGGMTVALFLEMMAQEKARASELFSRIPLYYPVRLKIPMSRDTAERVVAELVKEYREKTDNIIDIDGIRVDGDDYWFLVRPSGTEPVLRVMVEARSPEKAEKLAKELEEKVKRMIA